MPCTSTTCRERRRPQGFTLISAIFLLVVVTALAVGMGQLSQRLQLGAAGEIETARALQGARAGLEWGTWQVMRNPPAPAAAPACFGATSLTLPGQLSGLTVTVRCTRTPASGTQSDGTTALAFFSLVATACNRPEAGACPASGTPELGYGERQLSWLVAR